MDRSRSSGYYIFECLKKWQFTFVRAFLKQKGISDWCDSPNFTMLLRETTQITTKMQLCQSIAFNLLYACLYMDIQTKC